MRIGILGHLLNFAPGYRQAGVSRYIEFLAGALAEVVSGERVTLYVNRPTAGELRRDVTGQQIALSTTRLPTERPAVRILWEQAIAPAVIARDRIDVVHAPVNVAPLLTRRRRVVTVHDLAFAIYPDQYPGIKQRYLNALTRRSVERASRVIAVSENTRRDILRFYRVPPERVVTVPNGVAASFFARAPEARVADLRRQRGLPERFILFVGTLQPRKNLIGLLRAYSRLSPGLRPPLVVVGAPGWMYEPIAAEARSLGVADEVIFAGYADAETLPLWYSAATLFVYPSLYEGFGLPVVEAMAAGTPVVTSTASSLPEVAGDAAVLAPPDDVDALAAALGRVLTDDGLRAELRRRGRERAREFTWERTARETLAVYRDAARRRST